MCVRLCRCNTPFQTLFLKKKVALAAGVVRAMQNSGGHRSGAPARAAHPNPANVGLLPHELGELARIASGLHAASFLSCMVVPYLYLTTNKRRRARTAKLLFFLSLAGAVLALITGFEEWSTAAACLGASLCRREPTSMMAFWESARILGLHCCGAWTSCIAFHILREQMEALGLGGYNFQRTQRVYHFVGWIAPLVHMQVCIALKSAVSPKAARCPSSGPAPVFAVCVGSVGE